ncbi:BolA family protein [Magnetospirillum molischianum]|uniref:BolA family transcriptional regulator n=1 Tax=Magnetospirillum molischianum DSM 120 TaxID=1150626 RepID=H8FUI4_MAGML|nr:BolA family transcriptional regulator [Magnetospirillum molischianum]CCG42022.1 conserved hypothetical protein; BolA-like protein [Magnetospirillum molischianum DSM 120]
MPMSATEIEQLICAGLPDAKVVIEDLRGDGDHYSALVVSPSFNGLSRVRRHQAVYDALGGKMGGELHALMLKTLTPEEDSV